MEKFPGPVRHSDASSLFTRGARGRHEGGRVAHEQGSCLSSDIRGDCRRPRNKSEIRKEEALQLGRRFFCGTRRKGVVMGGQPITCPSFKAFANQLERWRLQRLENGLRVFEEEDVPRIRSALPPGCKVSEAFVRRTGEEGTHSLISVSRSFPLAPYTYPQAVGLVFSRPALIFKLVMDLGKSRCHWDLTFDSGAVIKHIDENTDVIQVTFRQQVSGPLLCLSSAQLHLKQTYSDLFAALNRPAVHSSDVLFDATLEL